jgi:glycine/D-amino acid oxidase-like deaminating enzyme
MRTRYGVSPWIENFPTSRRPEYPRLRGEHTVSVLIVGGGLTGCATAYACAVAGLRPVLVEAGRIGQGSAGRSAGLLLPEPGPSFRDLAGAHGVRTARRIFEGWRKASLDAAALLRRLRIRCDLDTRGSIVIASDRDEKLLRREFDARRDAGLDAAWLGPKQARAATALDVGAALKTRDAFSVDPYRACLGLAAAAIKRGARVFEHTRLTKVRWGRTTLDAALDAGAVRAGTIVVTTGAATDEYKPLRRHFKSRETYLVMTEPVPSAMRKQLGPRDVALRDSRSPRRRVAWTHDDRLLVAGGDQDAMPSRARDAVLVQRTGQLMYELLTLYPAISGLRPEFGWDLSYGETADGVMYIGPHRNYPHHLFALGGGGDSITGAFLSARLLARTLAGAADKADAAFGWTR